MGKYEPLTNYLLNCNQKEITLTLDQIDEILGNENLPISAKKNNSWIKSVHSDKPFSKGWLDAGYCVVDRNIVNGNGTVTFKKIGGKAKKKTQKSKPKNSSKVGGLNTPKKESTKSLNAGAPKGKVIILNKLFRGEWLDVENHIGHEIIDFLKTDNGEHYAYNIKAGTCPHEIVDEKVKKCGGKYQAKYLVLTSEQREGTFKILYVVEIEKILHHYEQKQDENELKENQEKVKKIIDDNKIIYNGKPLYDIFKGDTSLYLTFKVKNMYQVIDPIIISSKYYFRSNGYCYSDVTQSDLYNDIITKIEKAKSEGNLRKFTPRKVREEEISVIEKRKTFLDLICKEFDEQVFTNMLYSVLEQKDFLKQFCQKFKKNDQKLDDDKFDVYREKIIDNGRMDIAAESSKQRVIIENKIYSGLNGKKEDQTQLSTYYNQWGILKTLEPLCFVIAPDFKMLDLEKQINTLDKDMVDVYTKVKFSEVKEFLESIKAQIPDTYIYKRFYEDIILAFENLSHETEEDFYASMFLNRTQKQ